MGGFGRGLAFAFRSPISLKISGFRRPSLQLFLGNFSGRHLSPNTQNGSKRINLATILGFGGPKDDQRINQHLPCSAGQ